MDPLAQGGVALAAVGAPCAAMAWAVRGRSAGLFGTTVWHGPRDAPAVALTFDDGPSESTARILDALATHSVPATFFQVGRNVERLPAVAREVVAAGHEIGNHSYAHPMFCFRSPGFMEEDLRGAQNAIAAHAGVRPVLYRAPFGVRWFGMGGVQRRLGLTGITWTVIGYDWKRKTDEIVKRLCTRVSNGAILCLHDGRELQVRPDIGVTVEAVRRVVPRLLDRGFRFETVSRLLCPKT